ncbi:MAG TPA: hypothetical protein PLV06_11915 [Bacteroidales bacterium]|nr:hypothetical protein [Bacteroidales bacterium]HPF03431.1 hypothetical protein [Bacteroidales bacterium]HPJ59951.1 hypothetical protein [Bacteroidales bacterium]HPR13084.1 hypothetical protein [Bacteroidales bacterium]HRW85704.1 hypothetical protein [Bacteroidales bacterium]
MGSRKDSLKFNPFPGLRPFAEEESELFFGRKKESLEVLDKLIENRFVTVIGASGTGKSSLIYCGVLPQIRIRASSEGETWRIIKFRPGNDPFGNLGEAIADNLKGRGLHKTGADDIMVDMHLNADGIKGSVAKYLSSEGERVLLVVDQFEELFRYGAASPGEKRKMHVDEFVTKLVSAVTDADGKIYTLVTMRSDFVGECAHYQGLTQLINNSNYLVPHMGRANYREAIEGPVNYAGASINNELVEKILDEIGDRTDQLPVLQHALMRTWTYWQELDEKERPIGIKDYDSVGTMSEAMSRHANEAFEELDQKGRELCSKMFRTITEKGSDNKGVRRPTSVKNIISVTGCTSKELFTVIEKFRIPSRSFITPRQEVPLTDDSIIDLSHESLMRLWDRLRDWVDNESAAVQMYLRLSEASAMYQQGKTGLLRPPDLQLALNWREQQKPTLTWAQRYDPAFERAMVYLRTSEKAYLDEEESKMRLQRRQIRRTKIVAGILGAAAIISVGFMLFAFVQKIAADRQKILADRNAAEAIRQEQLALIQSDSATQARVRADRSAEQAIRNAEEAQLQRDKALQEQLRAERNAEIARLQEKIAREQSDSARQARERADTNAARATRERNLARRLRILSIGKSMSVKSLQVSGQKDLQTLLAYQAYLFNKRNGGLPNDADIYAGLYDVARQYGNVNYKTFRHDGIKSIAFVPGKREIYTSGDDRQIKKWSLDGNGQTYQVIYEGTEIIEVLAISPDASWLAAGSDKASIRMIPLKGNDMQYTLSGHNGNIRSLIFSFDGKYLYSAALDGKVLKWDLATRTSTDIGSGAGLITAIDISTRGQYLAGLNPEGNVILWNPESSTDKFRLPTMLKDIRTLRFKPEENTLAIGDVQGNVELWDIDTRKKIGEVKAHNAQVTDIQFNPVLGQMATASRDNSLKIYNNTDDLTEPPLTFTDVDAGFVLVVQFSSDGQLIVSGTYQPGQNLVVRPTNADLLAKDMCDQLTRNMTPEEWNTYVARDLPPEKTCEGKDLNIKINVVK